MLVPASRPAEGSHAAMPARSARPARWRCRGERLEAAGWLRRSWRNSNRKPVANRDLWEPLIEEYLSRPDEISFRWVKGHSSDEWSEIADQLASGAALDQRARRGDGSLR